MVFFLQILGRLLRWATGSTSASSNDALQEERLPWLERLWLVYQLIRFRLSWGVHDNFLVPSESTAVTAALRESVAANPKFQSPFDAARRIPSNATVLSCGFAGFEVSYAFHMALPDVYRREGRPAGLTWITVNSHGARGVAPGSVDELAAVPGIVQRYIAGHLETARGMLSAGAAGTVELQNVPLGVLAQLVAQQASTGETSLTTEVGVGTFLDPLAPAHAKEALQTMAPRSPAVAADSGESQPRKLRYTIPPIDVVVLNARVVDVEGNAYFHESVVTTECFDGPKAARRVGRDGGLVLVAAQCVIPGPPSGVDPSLVLSASMIDAICLCTAPRMMTNFFGIRPALLPSARTHLSVEEQLHVWKKMRFVNRFIGATPKRGPVDLVLGRTAAQVFVSTFTSSAKTTTTMPQDGVEYAAEERFYATIGTGLPEEVSANVVRAGLARDIALCTEAGSVGGIPGMGLFFGSAIGPERIIPEPAVFTLLESRLWTTCLGALEVDVRGNVNVSRRGEGTKRFAGTGGFPNFTSYAKNIVFIFKWVSSKGGAVRVDSHRGTVSVPVPTDEVHRKHFKLCRHVREVTFCAEEAIRRKQNVYYCTSVGVMKLDHERKKLRLVAVAPGVHAQRDVGSPFDVLVDDDVPVLDPSVVTGDKTYRLTLPPPV